MMESPCWRSSEECAANTRIASGGTAQKGRRSSLTCWKSSMLWTSRLRAYLYHYSPCQCCRASFRYRHNVHLFVTWRWMPAISPPIRLHGLLEGPTAIRFVLLEPIVGLAHELPDRMLVLPDQPRERRLHLLPDMLPDALLARPGHGRQPFLVQHAVTRGAPEDGKVTAQQCEQDRDGDEDQQSEPGGGGGRYHRGGISSARPFSARLLGSELRGSTRCTTAAFVMLEVRSSVVRPPFGKCRVGKRRVLWSWIVECDWDKGSLLIGTGGSPDRSQPHRRG